MEKEKPNLLVVLILIFKLVKRIIYNIKKPILIKRANKWSKLTGYRYLVIYYEGKLRLAKKKNLKALIAKRRFKKGTTIQMLEKSAVYVTP